MASFLEDARLAVASLSSFAHDLVQPTLRLGVTGLSRAGKTVFITALVNGLLRDARWPVFEPMARGRIRRVMLADQPDDGVPRFPLEANLRALSGPDRRWPEGTTRISELRVVIDYMVEGGFLRSPERRLTLDIVDYPGEWLLDLPLLDKSYRQWADETLAMSRQPARAPLAAEFHARLAEIDPAKPLDDERLSTLAAAFTGYLKACRDDAVNMSALPPGRFLMPGDMAGSPALTFAPLPEAAAGGEDSISARMERRFESYKRLVVLPFFRDHFALLDRQIVLVDALSAINAGPAALSDLEIAMADILKAFRHGANGWLSSVVARRIDRVLFAATKADHLHAASHDRLEAILSRLSRRAVDRAAFAGAEVDVIALAALRATRQTEVTRDGERLSCIVGTPLAGETVGGRVFDGTTEAVVFPGDLPEDPEAVFQAPPSPEDRANRFVRFRPPETPDWGQIRLDRAAQFLLGDRLT